MTDRCGIGHKLATAAGFVASITIGGEGLPDALKGLGIKTKQAIGEGLSYVENTLAGSTRVGAQVPASQLGLEGLTTTFDSVWQSAGKGIYYVESKFGTSRLRPAQELAQAVLGSAYHVERWGYPFFARIGGYLGAGWGGAGVMAGHSCGCK